MADLDVLLEKTSRTFALAIPLLPEPTRRDVTVAYLLFRIADTFEDAASWDPSARVEALRAFRSLVEDPSPSEARRLAALWSSAEPSTHPGYRRLVAEVPGVVAAFGALREDARRPVRDHVLRSARGMEEFVLKGTGSGGLSLATLEELQAYCYAVAGIVGEMLTELFLLGRRGLAEAAGALRSRAAAFGEGLQLVNILKDAAQDAAEGRRFLPTSVPRSQVFDRARTDLGIASEYIHDLQAAGAPRGIVEFTALPVLLARATLDGVEARGPGAKISRHEVFLIRRRLASALERGAPAVDIGRALRRRIIPRSPGEPPQGEV